MPPARNVFFEGINVNNPETYSLLENISYEATESTLHDIVDRLDYIIGPRSQEVKEKLVAAHRAIEALEATMMDVTTFQRQPQRYAVPAEEAYDPRYYGAGAQVQAVQEDPVGIPAEQVYDAGHYVGAQVPPIRHNQEVAAENYSNHPNIHHELAPQAENNLRPRRGAGEWVDVGVQNFVVRYEEPVVQQGQDLESEIANRLREEIEAEYRAESSAD